MLGCPTKWIQCKTNRGCRSTEPMANVSCPVSSSPVRAIPTNKAARWEDTQLQVVTWSRATCHVIRSSRSSANQRLACHPRPPIGELREFAHGSSLPPSYPKSCCIYLKFFDNGFLVVAYPICVRIFITL